MRKTILLVLLMFIAAACSKKEIKDEFSYEPINPKSGDQITVYFMPDTTALKESKEITMNAYAYNTEIIEAVGSEMTNEGGYWKAVFNASPEAKGIIVKFTSGETEENNNGKGYVIYLNENNPEQLAEAKAGYAASMTGWGRAAGVERDPEAALDMFDKVFSDFPAIKKNYFKDYINAIQRVGDEDKLKSEVTKFAENTENMTDEEYYTLFTMYDQLLANKEKADEIKTEALEKYPNGKFKLLELRKKMNEETDFAKKLEVFDQIVQEFPNSEDVKGMYDSFAVQLTREKKYDMLWDYLMKYGNRVSPYYRYYAANRIIDEDGDKTMAEKISANGVTFGRNEYENPTLDKPKTSTTKEWKESRGFELGMNLFIHGKIMYNEGNLDQAAKELKEAVELTKDYYPQEALNNLYITVLSDQGKNDEVMKAAEEFIKTGNSSSVILEKLKAAYIAKNNGVEGFEEYMSKYSEMAKQMMKDELKGEMLNEPAPDFTLYDLEGKEVSLSDFKGKNVIVDFWATWCGPCLKSFPGMKIAQEKFGTDSDTKFLFVNTWERVEDKEQNAKDFIAKNDYPFHVLLDKENEVVAKYKVSGIPTKFVVDKKGNIRFRVVGFNGNTQKIVDELEVMLNLIK